MLPQRKWVLFFGFFAIVLHAALFGMIPQAAAQESDEETRLNIYYFWGDGCPYCMAMKPFLEELPDRYPGVALQSYEVWYVEENRGIFFSMANKFGFEPGGVPATFIGDRFWVGFNETMKAEIEAVVQACLQTGCPEAGVGIQGIPNEILVRDQSKAPAIAPEDPTIAPATEPTAEPAGATPVEPEERRNILTLPLVGDIDLNQHSLFFSTAVIAFVDGFNPCSLWVLSILLALVIHSGSRRKTLIVGLTFLLVTAGIYGLFIAGLFKVFTVVSFLGWIRVVVAVIALTFAAINIKDYFWYKEGVSLTISDKHKPKIYQDFREILKGDKSIWALIGATVVMAAGIAIVELPCTAGFPVLWSQLVAAQNVDSFTFSLLLGVYILVYLLDELIIFGIAVVTLRASKMEEKHGRILKLIGGVLMAALALVLIFRPEFMESFNDSLMVFAGAFLAAGLILLLHRTILPGLGIHIGTEKPNPRRKKGR
jgi:thiol-disulfide isomerase/thioredoxin